MPQKIQNKVIRDNKVAIAISEGFGDGWTTWNEVSPAEPKVIEMIEKGKQTDIDTEWCERELGLKNQYCGGAHNLDIVWVPLGAKFSIKEYDGAESIYIDSELDWEA